MPTRSASCDVVVDHPVRHGRDDGRRPSSARGRRHATSILYLAAAHAVTESVAAVAILWSTLAMSSISLSPPPRRTTAASSPPLRIPLRQPTISTTTQPSLPQAVTTTVQPSQQKLPPPPPKPAALVDVIVVVVVVDVVVHENVRLVLPVISLDVRRLFVIFGALDLGPELLLAVCATRRECASVAVRRSDRILRSLTF